MKILVPVDGSPFTKRMLAYLATHDEWLGGDHEYTVLHAVPPVPPRAAAVLERDVLKGYYDEAAEKVTLLDCPTCSLRIRVLYAQAGVGSEG